MDKDIFALNNQTYSDNNNILLEIINELEQIANSSRENITIKKISDVIIKMNFIMNQFIKLENQISQLSQNLKINNINNQQELKGIKNGHNWRYVGQIVKGLKEGKGIEYYNDGDRYEGDFRNGKKEGKGIYYFNKEPFKGDRYEGDFRNGKSEGKGIYYWNNGNIYEGDYRNDQKEGKGIEYYNNGDRYEGDFRNDKKEGKGVYYMNNGDRMMGDYHNDKPTGKHVMLARNGDVNAYNY